MRAVLPACSVLAGRHVDKIVSLIDVAGVRMRCGRREGITAERANHAP